MPLLGRWWFPMILTLPILRWRKTWDLLKSLLICTEQWFLLQLALYWHEPLVNRQSKMLYWWLPCHLMLRSDTWTWAKDSHSPSTPTNGEPPDPLLWQNSRRGWGWGNRGGAGSVPSDVSQKQILHFGFLMGVSGNWEGFNLWNSRDTHNFPNTPFPTTEAHNVLLLCKIG